MYDGAPAITDRHVGLPRADVEVVPETAQYVQLLEVPLGPSQAHAPSANARFCQVHLVLRGFYTLGHPWREPLGYPGRRNVARWEEVVNLVGVAQGGEIGPIFGTHLVGVARGGEIGPIFGANLVGVRQGGVAVRGGACLSHAPWA